MKTKSRSTRCRLRIARMHHDHAHHAHGHLHHLVGMGVVHEGAALLQLELVDEGLARRDVRLGEAANAVHAVRHEHAVPMHLVCSGSLLVTKTRILSPSTASMVGPGAWPL